MIKFSKFTKNAIASIVSLQLITLPIIANADVSIDELQKQAGIVKEDDPNLGGGNIGNGVGTSSGSSALDDINNARCVDTQFLSGKMITDVCWTCIFPIISLGMPLGASKSEAPDDRAKKIVCLCKDDLGVPYPGFTYGMWMPSKLVELVRMPGCLATLGGVTLNFDKIDQGTWQTQEQTTEMTQAAHAHYHTYAFPILVMLNMFEQSECIKDHYVDIDLLYLSEFDPTWYDDNIAFFTNPEAVLLGNPISMLACVPDALSSTALQKPINSLFWCAGSWGNMYPLTTNVSSGGEIMESSLMMARLLSALHRRFFLKKTYTDEALCSSTMAFFIPKTQYKITMIYPVPERKSAHVIGESDIFWGANRSVPVTGEDFVYLMWTWNDCCMSMVAGSADQ